MIEGEKKNKTRLGRDLRACSIYSTCPSCLVLRLVTYTGLLGLISFIFHRISEELLKIEIIMIIVIATVTFIICPGESGNPKMTSSSRGPPRLGLYCRYNRTGENSLNTAWSFSPAILCHCRQSKWGPLEKSGGSLGVRLTTPEPRKSGDPRSHMKRVHAPPMLNFVKSRARWK